MLFTTCYARGSVSWQQLTDASERAYVRRIVRSQDERVIARADTQFENERA